MKKNTTTKRFDPAKIRAFIGQVEAVFSHAQKQQALERIICFQPVIKNTRMLGSCEIDTFLLPYLVQNIQLRIERKDKEGAQNAMIMWEKQRGVAAASASNHMDFLLRVKLLEARLIGIVETSDTRELHEAFWRIKVARDRFEEYQGFALALGRLFRKIFKRRLFVFASERKKKVFPKGVLQEACSRLQYLLVGKTCEKYHETFPELIRNRRVFEFYERLTGEAAYSTFKQNCLRLIQEFDARPARFGALVDGRSDLLRFLLLFSSLEGLQERRVRLPAARELFSRLRRSRAPLKAQLEAMKFFLKIFSSYEGQRKWKILKLIQILPPRMRTKSKIVTSQLIEQSDVKLVRALSFRELHTFCLLLQQVFRQRKKVYFGFLKSRPKPKTEQKNQRIIYAKVEHLKKLPTVGSFVMGDTTQITTMTQPLNFALGQTRNLTPAKSGQIGKLNSAGSSWIRSRQKSDFKYHPAQRLQVDSFAPKVHPEVHQCTGEQPKRSENEIFSRLQRNISL